MKTMTIDNFKAAIQNAAAQHGERGALHAKAVMMNDCMIVDADGNPIAPDAMDVVLQPAMAAAPMEDSADTSSAADAVAKAVRSEIRAAIADNSVPVRKGISVPSDDAIRPYGGRVKSFKDERTAYRFGRFLFAAAGHSKSADWCNRNGLNLKAHSEGVNSQGGFLVPDEFEATLISLREQFGVARANCKVYPMSRDTLNIPRRIGGLTSYWTGETAATTESTLTLSNVSLVAKKLSALTTTSNELAEDSIIPIADLVADEIAYEFARKEDDALFNGDGSSSYGGIVGLKNALGAASIIDSGVSTSALSTITAASISGWFAAVPAYALTPNAKIYCHKAVYHSIFERISHTAGGATVAESVNGTREFRFYGYPVVFVQGMSSVTGTGTDGVHIAYIGDLAQAAAFGDRRQVTIRTSDSALNAFEQDELAIRGTERVDIVVHGTGDATTAGPIIALTR